VIQCLQYGIAQRKQSHLDWTPGKGRGNQVYTVRLQTRSWDDKDGKKQYMTEVVADEVILLGGRGGEGQDSGPQPVSMPRSAPRPQPAAAAGDEMGPDQGITDDDVPF
jgi:single-strand DNA-binding protein